MRNILTILFCCVALAVLSCKRPPSSLQQNTTTQKATKNTGVRPTSTTRGKVDQTDVSRRKGSKTEVNMTKRGGVYFVPIKINDVAMDIIFDTGASIISISLTELRFLIKQGKIKEEDFLRTQMFQDATGGVSEGVIVNLKKVQIGDRAIYNVEASVVDNLDAPLLLGQSLLAEFGKVTIDYNANTISLE